MFLPDQVGLIDMVYPKDVQSIDFAQTPVSVDIQKAGHYLIYTNDYDLLTINDSILKSHAKPWLNAESKDGEIINVELVSRGLILFDTPFASGRPVVRLFFPGSGEYQFFHPTRPIRVDLVPDYLTGNEATLVLFLILQVTIFGLPLYRYGIKRMKLSRDRRILIQQRNRERVEASRKKVVVDKHASSIYHEDQNIWRPKR